MLAANRQRAHDGRAVARDAAARRRRRRRLPSRGVDVDRARDHRAANAPTRRAPTYENVPADARAAATSRRCASRSTRKSSASPAGSSSTAASLAVVGFSARRVRRRVLGFLWPHGLGGLRRQGRRRQARRHPRRTSTAQAAPFYIPEARAYVVQYPKARPRRAAKKIYSAGHLRGHGAGLVALYQRCVHLGCRVPWCQTSQWFECPCHGSKYNRVGEKKAGPAPRGLDRFAHHSSAAAA